MASLPEFLALNYPSRIWDSGAPPAPPSHAVVAAQLARSHPDVSVDEKRILKGVVALKGMSTDALGAVLAHEYGHCYLFMRKFPLLPLAMEEGVCELFAWLWLGGGCRRGGGGRCGSRCRCGGGGCDGRGLLHMHLARDAHIQAVVFAVVAFDLKFGQVIGPQQLRQRLDEGHVFVMFGHLISPTLCTPVSWRGFLSDAGARARRASALVWRSLYASWA